MWRHARIRDELDPRSTEPGGATPGALPRLDGRLSRTVDGHALLTASWGGLAFRKEIRADGSFHALVDQGRDRLALCGSRVGLHLTYGTRSLTVSPAESTDEIRRRARELLLAAPVAQIFRRLGGDLEETGALHPEAYGVRVTSALLAEIDGDESAVRRLSRAVMAHERSLNAAKMGAPDGDRATRGFVEQMLRASVQLEQRMTRSSNWSPARAAAALDWALQVEAAIFALAVTGHAASASRQVPDPGRKP